MEKFSGYMEVELGGKIRPLKFGMGAWKIFTEVTELPLEKLGEVDMMSFPAIIIYAGAKQAALAKNKEIDFNLAMVYDWIDEISEDTFRDISKCLASSKIMGRTFKDIVSDTVKKKTVQS